VLKSKTEERLALEGQSLEAILRPNPDLILKQTSWMNVRAAVGGEDRGQEQPSPVLKLLHLACIRVPVKTHINICGDHIRQCHQVPAYVVVKSRPH
jgi:hypothetical protein